ncbi:MAG: hypothetical protein OER86_11480, partial [Phycisphaerae bacterium]|nr:hypothetical protein [Phycisphaerae bacterium]
MRVVIVLVALIGGAAAGLFVGGTTYDALNPAPGVDLPDGSTSDAEALSRSNRQVGAAFDRMEGRKPWLIGGAVAGAVIG